MPVTPGLAPSQAFVRIVHDELIEVMGGQSEGLALNAQPPAVILMAGLQGVGKTTTAENRCLARAARTKESHARKYRCLPSRSHGTVGAIG